MRSVEWVNLTRIRLSDTYVSQASRDATRSGSPSCTQHLDGEDPGPLERAWRECFVVPPVQYDLGKATTSGFERTGALNTPPTVLLNAVANVRAKQMRGKGRLLEYLSKLDSLPDFTREAAGWDTLFEAEYEHAGKGSTCANCSTEHAVDREPRRQEVVVHHGTIASGNQVIKDAAVRDKLSAELGGVLSITCWENFSHRHRV
jgi:hypothetical protein